MQNVSRMGLTGLVALTMLVAGTAAFASGGSTTSGTGVDPGVSSGGGGGGTGGSGGTGGGGGSQPATVCVPLASSVSFAPPVVVGGPDQVVVNSTYSNCTRKDAATSVVIEFGALDTVGNFLSAQAYYGPAPTGCFQTLLFDHSGGVVRAGTSKTYAISRDMPACNGTYYVRTTVYSLAGAGVTLMPFTVTSN